MTFFTLNRFCPLSIPPLPLLKQLKSLSLKIGEATSKSVVITEKKGKQYVRQIIYINQGYLPTKVTPVIDFTDEPIIQCEVTVVENTFVFR